MNAPVKKPKPPKLREWGWFSARIIPGYCSATKFPTEPAGVVKMLVLFLERSKFLMFFKQPPQILENLDAEALASRFAWCPTAAFREGRPWALCRLFPCPSLDSGLDQRYGKKFLLKATVRTR
jgi:hypothetical protein